MKKSNANYEYTRYKRLKQFIEFYFSKIDSATSKRI